MRKPGEFDADQAEAFLRGMFGDKPQNHYLLLWTWPDKRSAWCRDADDLIGCAGLESYYQKDIYIGCGTSRHDFGVTRRCKADDIAGIPGVWADIDVACPESKRRRAPDVETALAWARELDPTPTFIVNSGHGLHLWWKAPFWVFKSPKLRLELQDDFELESREAAAVMMHHFQDWLRAQAPDWEIDGTHNLDRVLRLPGTWNWKCPTNPRPVELVM